MYFRGWVVGKYFLLSKVKVFKLVTLHPYNKWAKLAGVSNKQISKMNFENSLCQNHSEVWKQTWPIHRVRPLPIAGGSQQTCPCCGFGGVRAAKFDLVLTASSTSHTWQVGVKIFDDWRWPLNYFWLEFHIVNMAMMNLQLALWSVPMRCLSIFTGWSFWKYKYVQILDAGCKCPRTCQPSKYVTMSKAARNVAKLTFKDAS